MTLSPRPPDASRAARNRDRSLSVLAVLTGALATGSLAATGLATAGAANVTAERDAAVAPHGRRVLHIHRTVVVLPAPGAGARATGGVAGWVARPATPAAPAPRPAPARAQQPPVTSSGS